MIDPTAFPEVEDAFCNISTDKRRRLQLLHEDLSAVIAEMQELSLYSREGSADADELQATYEQTLDLRAQKHELLRLIDLAGLTPDVVHDDELVQRRKQDFAKICALPQVIDAQVEDGGAVSFLIHGRYVYKGATYFLGDWRVSFGDFRKHDSYQVILARSGLKDSWDNGYPDYTYPGPIEAFCLGVNTALVQRHFNNFQFYYGMQLVAVAICSVNNASDEKHLPRAFHLDSNKGDN